jgi:hydroxymethylpyrimidine pyrophosphatase-like HAD family hydrolase
MKEIEYMTDETLKDIKLIVFDVDGVLVPRGTNIKQTGNITTLETKRIAEKQINQIKDLNDRGFLVNISSGRSLFMLQDMFREVLPFVSITYENGSATWYQGRLIQHFNSYKYLEDVFPFLLKVRHENIKGFEPKEFIITIHATARVPEIELIVKRYSQLYCIWNGEAYDIGVKHLQTKGIGLQRVITLFKLRKKNVLAIGDNYNDVELLDRAGIPVSADKERVTGKFFVHLDAELLPADQLMSQIIKMTASRDLKVAVLNST